MLRRTRQPRVGPDLCGPGFSNRLKRIAFLRIGPAARIGRGDKASLVGAGGLIFRSWSELIWVI